LPRPLARGLAALGKGLRGPGFRRDLALFRLEQLTGFGFFPVPEPRSACEIAPRDAFVLADPDHPIVFASIGAELVIAANGQSFAAPRSATLVRALASINRGQPYVVGSRRTAPALVLARVLQELYAARAIEKVSEPRERAR